MSTGERVRLESHRQVQAFPEDEWPRDLLHDRDRALAALGATASGMSIEKIRTAPRSPWQKNWPASPSFIPPNSA